MMSKFFIYVKKAYFQTPVHEIENQENHHALTQSGLNLSTFAESFKKCWKFKSND